MKKAFVLTSLAAALAIGPAAQALTMDELQACSKQDVVNLKASTSYYDVIVNRNFSATGVYLLLTSKYAVASDPLLEGASATQIHKALMNLSSIVNKSKTCDEVKEQALATTDFKNIYQKNLKQIRDSFQKFNNLLKEELALLGLQKGSETITGNEDFLVTILTTSVIDLAYFDSLHKDLDEELRLASINFDQRFFNPTDSVKGEKASDTSLIQKEMELIYDRIERQTQERLANATAEELEMAGVQFSISRALQRWNSEGIQVRTLK